MLPHQILKYFCLRIAKVQVTPTAIHSISTIRAAAYQDFLSAESRGRFFRSHIRDHFRYERVAKLRAA